MFGKKVIVFFVLMMFTAIGGATPPDHDPAAAKLRPRSDAGPKERLAPGENPQPRPPVTEPFAGSDRSDLRWLVRGDDWYKSGPAVGAAMEYKKRLDILLGDIDQMPAWELSTLYQRHYGNWRNSTYPTSWGSNPTATREEMKKAVFDHYARKARATMAQEDKSDAAVLKYLQLFFPGALLKGPTDHRLPLPFPDDEEKKIRERVKRDATTALETINAGLAKHEAWIRDSREEAFDDLMQSFRAAGADGARALIPYYHPYAPVGADDLERYWKSKASDYQPLVFKNYFAAKPVATPVSPIAELRKAERRERPIPIGEHRSVGRAIPIITEGRDADLKAMDARIAAKFANEPRKPLPSIPSMSAMTREEAATSAAISAALKARVESYMKANPLVSQEAAEQQVLGEVYRPKKIPLIQSSGFARQLRERYERNYPGIIRTTPVRGK